MDIGPVPFSPNNDGRDDLLAITLKVPPGNSVTITIYGFDGRQEKQFANNLQSTLLWNGNDG